MGQVFRQTKQVPTMAQKIVLIPDEWGKSSDMEQMNDRVLSGVLIPDEWGKSSDDFGFEEDAGRQVLIPDEWGKSSDCTQSKNFIIFRLLYS